MRIRFVFALISLFALAFYFNSCKHEPEDSPQPGNGGENPPEGCDSLFVTYANNVVPIFESKCNWCHSGDLPDGNIDLTDFDQVSIIAQNGALIGALEHQAGFSPMPKDGDKLSLCEIEIIKIWIRDTTFPDPPDPHPCDPDTIYFEMDVLPILQSSCALAECHDAITQEEGIQLTDYALVIETGKIKPFDPGDSEMYEVIISTDPDKIMPPPPAQALTPGQKEVIRKWIEQGAQNLFCDEMCDTLNVTYSGTIWPIIQNSCFGCHNSSNASGGLLLENYEQVKAIAADGSLMGVINHIAGYNSMPKNGNQLSECKREQIKNWIEDGMQNN